MEIARFDRITSTFAKTSSRRSALRYLAAAAFGVGGLSVIGAESTDAKKKRGKKGGKGGGKNGGQPTDNGTTSTGSSTGSGTGSGGSGTTVPANRCGGPVGICNANPTPCGTTAEGKICGCERAVEGNNVCVNSGADNVCATAVECTSTSGSEATSCRNVVGFHFYCQEAKKAGSQFCGCGFGTTTGRVCVPECDNTNPF